MLFLTINAKMSKATNNGFSNFRNLNAAFHKRDFRLVSRKWVTHGECYPGAIEA